MPIEIIKARLAAVRLQVIDQEVALMALKEYHEYDVKYCDDEYVSWCEYDSELLVEEKKLLALESAAKELVLVLGLIS